MKKIILVLLMMWCVCLTGQVSEAYFGDYYLNYDEKISIETDGSDNFYLPNMGTQSDNVVAISNIRVKMGETEEITTRYNEYIVVEFGSQYQEYSLKSNQTSLTFSAYNDGDDFGNYITIDFSMDYLDFDDVTGYESILFDIVVTKKVRNPKISKKNMSLYLDGYNKTLKLDNVSERVKWKSSNKKVATVIVGEARFDRVVYVEPKRIGTCYITATCGDKSFRCKINVVGRKKLKLIGELISYDTRSNTFKVRFQNCSKKPITICSTDAIAVDSDYTSYDRKLKLSKPIKIKCGKRKTVKFKVIGTTTWPKVNDFCINYNVKYKGKKYRMATSVECTYIRIKGKWRHHSDS